MVLVDHVVADSEILEYPESSLTTGPGPPSSAAAARDLGFGDHGQLRPVEEKAPLQGSDDQVGAGYSRVGRRFLLCQDKAVLGKPLQQLYGASLPVGGYHHPEPVGQQFGQA